MQLIMTEDGRRKAMCPNDGTWGFISEAQYRGEAECVCPHPACGHKWTHSYANDAAEAAKAADAKAGLPDHF